MTKVIAELRTLWDPESEHYEKSMNDTAPDALIFLIADSVVEATRIAIASDGKVELCLEAGIVFRPTKKMAEDFKDRGLRARAK